MRCLLAVLCACFAGGALADDAQQLRSGSYSVEVALELPHVESSAAHRNAHLCVDAAEAGGTFGLAVLSENNPLAKCEKSKARLEGRVLTFEVACAGLNAARGHARFELYSDRFMGRIDMKMGGKNMTMTEVQSGKWAGECLEKPRS